MVYSEIRRKPDASAKAVEDLIKGTLGIVRRLMENGAFERDLEELFTNLKAIGFRIRTELFREIFSEIDQKR